MKINKLIFGVVLILFASLYYIERELYYYGRNSFDIFDLLPLKIKPAFWSQSKGNFGFVLLEAESTLIANGNRYIGSNITVHEVIKYGFNDSKLMALIEDKKQNKYMIVCSKNSDIKSKREIVINVINFDELVKFENYHWVDVKSKKDYAIRMELYRNYLLLTIFILIIVLMYRVFKLKKSSI